MIERFRTGQRIRVTAHGSTPEMNGRTGTVYRLLIKTSDAAWIAFDEDLPQHCRRFPADDPRANHQKIYYDECEAV